MRHEYHFGPFSFISSTIHNLKNSTIWAHEVLGLLAHPRPTQHKIKGPVYFIFTSQILRFKNWNPNPNKEISCGINSVGSSHPARIQRDKKKGAFLIVVGLVREGVLVGLYSDLVLVSLVPLFLPFDHHKGTTYKPCSFLLIWPLCIRFWSLKESARKGYICIRFKHT